MPKQVRTGRRHLFLPLIVLFSFILPLLLVIAGVVIFRTSNKFLQTVQEKEKEEAEVRLIPSQVLRNKSQYHEQRITVRGRIDLSPVVCEKKECPEDICCGCPTERDLVIYDAGSLLKSSGGEKLRLKDIFTNQALCQRKTGSCDYLCDDWIKGAIYDVYGKFFSEPAPPGWQKSLNYYFLVEGKNLVKTISLTESFSSFINDLKGKFSGFKTSGQFVLP